MAPKHRVGFREDFFFGVFNTRTVLLQVDRFMDEVKKKPSEIWLGSRGFSWQWFPNRGAGPFYGCETLANGGSGREINFYFKIDFSFRCGELGMWQCELKGGRCRHHSLSSNWQLYWPSVHSCSWLAVIQSVQLSSTETPRKKSLFPWNSCHKASTVHPWDQISTLTPPWILWLFI